MSSSSLGPVNKTRRKDDLIDIARAIKIPQHDTMDYHNVNKEKLVKLIRDHLDAHQARLSIDPKFQVLYAYRPTTGRAVAVTSHKNSADKAIEDAAENAKLQPAATGAHKKLLDAKRTTDPPGQRGNYQLLVTTRSKHDTEQPFHRDASSGLSSVSPLSSPSPSAQVAGRKERSEQPTAFQSPPPDTQNIVVGVPPRPGSPPRTSGLPSTPKKQTVRTDYNIRVTFRDIDGHRDPQEVWIAGGQNIPIDRRLSESGKHEACFARLSSIVPAALEQDTPIRKAGGRIWRTATGTDRAKINIGSIESFLKEGKLKALCLPQVDMYELEKLSDGNLACEVLLQCEPRTQQPQELQPSKVAVVPVAPPPTPSKMKARTKNASKPAPNFDDNDIIKYFRGLFDSPHEWDRAETAGQCLERYLAVQAAWDVLHDLGVKQPSEGGWKLPDSHPQFPGARFRKEMVHEALNIKKGRASGDTNLFRVDIVSCPKLKPLSEWIKNPEDAGLKAKFHNMAIGALREWKAKHEQANAEAGTSSKVERTSGMKGKGRADKYKTRKRARTPQLSSDSSSESVSSKRKGKGKETLGGGTHRNQRRKYNNESDNLDDTMSE
ncbi:hypothetical protein BC835DRAFT_1302977 [Cytidiella melzeri]|nr:hypothetical protein BC835DRAFT_1302977 [Cytidiella melzeri]